MEQLDQNSPIQPRLLSRINERLVLKLIQDRGPLTRSEMSKAIGVTFPTVAKAVSSLLDSSLLEEEIDGSTTARGRPAKRLRLASDKAQIICVDLSSTESSVIPAGLDGVPHEASRIKFPTPDNYDSLLLKLVASISQVRSNDDRLTLGIGITAPVVVDVDQERVLLSSRMPYLKGKNIGRDIEQLTRCKCVLIRDSHALCLSEQLHGPAGKVSEFALVDIGTGIGLGIVSDGRFLLGHGGLAGELGHIPIVLDGKTCRCGRRGCLETVASVWALESTVSEIVRRPVDIEQIIAMAQDGHPEVCAEVDRLCDYLAIGIAQVVGILNPGTLFVNGRLFQGLPHLLDRLWERVREHTLEPSFNSCEFRESKAVLLEGTVASVINALSDPKVPKLHEYVSDSASLQSVS